MELIITTGTQFEGNYSENSRFIISTWNADPTIGEILEAAKQLPQPAYLERLKSAFYLMHPETLQPLDESELASTYGLKDGSILRLMCSVR